MTISVVIPTLARPDGLLRCIEALRSQARKPDEVLVVARHSDAKTETALDGLGAVPGLRTVYADRLGQVAALNAGLTEATGNIIAITDDDAVPRPDWLERIESHFLADPAIGGVGGRDWVHDGPHVDDRSELRVGKLQWFGRVVGNHHIGVGPARDVDILKGANMSYRAAAVADIAFDDRLRGEGAQPGNDLAFSLRVRRSGWRLVYDPAVAVDHYPAGRADDPRSGMLPPDAMRITAHNQSLAVAEHLPPVRRVGFWLWAALVGTSSLPGVLQAARILVTRRVNPGPALLASLSGLAAGRRTSRSAERG